MTACDASRHPYVAILCLLTYHNSLPTFSDSAEPCPRLHIRPRTKGNIPAAYMRLTRYAYIQVTIAISHRVPKMPTGLHVLQLPVVYSTQIHRTLCTAKLGNSALNAFPLIRSPRPSPPVFQVSGARRCISGLSCGSRVRHHRRSPFGIGTMPSPSPRPRNTTGRTRRTWVLVPARYGMSSHSPHELPSGAARGSTHSSPWSVGRVRVSGLQ